MSSEPTEFNSSDPRIFSRASIHLSAKMVKHANPQLALSLNCIAGSPPLNSSGDRQNKHADHFKVDFDSFQVRAVVEAISAYMQEGAVDPGMAIVCKSLQDDWLKLARKMIEELPENQRP